MDGSHVSTAAGKAPLDEAPVAQKMINLALQGGGAHGVAVGERHRIHGAGSARAR